jgi:hypothetical protein
LSFALVLLGFGIALPTQALESGCRALPPAELIGRVDNLDYRITDTAGLNVVLVHVLGPTTLSDRSCLPDPEQGALQVVVNYGVLDASPEEQAREMIFGTHARSQPNRRPSDFPPISTETVEVNGLPGAEAISQDTTLQGSMVFRYALVVVFPNGATGLVSASGSAERLETLRPTFRRIAAGLRAN